MLEILFFSLINKKVNCRPYYYIAKLYNTHFTCSYKNYKPKLKLFKVAAKNDKNNNNYLAQCYYLATCARKAKVPGSSPAAIYVQR